MASCRKHRATFALALVVFAVAGMQVKPPNLIMSRLSSSRVKRSTIRDEEAKEERGAARDEHASVQQREAFPIQQDAASLSKSSTQPFATRQSNVGRARIKELQELARLAVFTHGGQVPVGERLRYAHMATAIPLAHNSTWLVAFQASTLYEGAGDQRIYVCTSTDGLNGTKWTLPVPAVPVTVPAAQWSPVLWTSSDRSSGTWLFFTQSTERDCIRPPEGKRPELWSPGGDILATTLNSDGSWSRPRLLLPQSPSRGTRGAPKVWKPVHHRADYLHPGSVC